MGHANTSSATSSASSAPSGRSCSSRDFRETSATATATMRRQGCITQEAFKVAGDPAVFPEQIAAGLRPWQPLKLYMGGVRESEDWTMRVDPGEYDPWLGRLVADVCASGTQLPAVAEQRTLRSAARPVRVGTTSVSQSLVDAPAKENDVLRRHRHDRAPVCIAALRRSAPGTRRALSTAIEREIQAAFDTFKFSDPSAPRRRSHGRSRQLAQRSRNSAPIRTSGSVLAREGAADSPTRFTRRSASSLTAIAQPAGTPEATGPFNARLRPRCRAGRPRTELRGSHACSRTAAGRGQRSRASEWRAKT